VEDRPVREIGVANVMDKDGIAQKRIEKSRMQSDEVGLVLVTATMRNFFGLLAVTVDRNSNTRRYLWEMERSAVARSRSGSSSMERDALTADGRRASMRLIRLIRTSQ
jgi:hypothetical protein